MKPLLTLLVLLAMNVARAATYYISYTDGNDANNGTSTNTPWKHHPDMKGWTGGSFTAQPGDRFIFKVNEVWPNAALSLYITDNGTSSNRIYLGCDTNWFSGATPYTVWTNGVGQKMTNSYWYLDAQGLDISDSRNIVGSSGGTRNNAVVVKGDYITIDGAAIRGIRINDNGAGGSPEPDSGTDHTLRIIGAVGFIGSNLYCHDWVVETIYGGDVGGPFGDGSTSTDSTITHSRIKGPTNVDPQYITASDGRDYGHGVRGFMKLINTDISYVGQGSWGNALVDGCIIHDMGRYTDKDAHENAIWAQNDATIRNTIIANTDGGVGMYVLPGFGGRTGRTIMVYNCLFYNTPQITISPQGSPDQSNEVYFFNNVVRKSSSCIQIGTTKSGQPFGTLAVQNNVFISENKYTNPDNVVRIIDAADLGSKYTNSHNVILTLAEATAAGLTEGNLWKPQSALGELVGQGVSYADITTTDIEGNERGSEWDIGPYEFEETEPNPGNVFFSAAVYSVDEDGTSITITVTRSGGSQGAVDVEFHTLDDTALAGTDYTTNSGTLSWADEELGYKTFNVSITDNGDEDGNRAFKVLLTNATGGLTIISPSNAVVTIVDDDDDGSEVPLMPSLTFEATDGLIESPFAESSGAIKQTVQTTDPALGGRARYRVTIPSTDQYIIKALVQAESTAADSLFVEFDEEPTSPSDIWDVQTLTSGFEERTVSHRGLGTFDDPDANPKIWTLSAGVHTLYIRGREAHTALKTLTIEALESPVPAAPSDLQVTPISTSQIDLDWTDNADNEDGFYIEASESGGPFVRIGTNTANDVSFSATGLSSGPSGVEYTFRVQAFNENGVSEYCDPVADFTEAAPEQQLRFFLPFRIAASE